MQLPNTNASHDFLFAKLHGLWANAVKGMSLDGLLKCATEELLQRALRPYGLDGTSREDFHKKLILREVSTLEQIARLLDERAGTYYMSIIYRYHIDNLKAVLNNRYFPEERTDIEHLIVTAPGLPILDTEKLLDASDAAAFVSLLPSVPGIPPKRLEAMALSLENEHDIMLAECELDQLYYEQALHAATACPADMNADAEFLLRCEIDIVNLCMLLRNVRTYHIEKERLEKLWLRGGVLLPQKLLDSLSTKKSVARIVAALPYRLNRMLQPYTEAELYLSENTLWKFLYGEAAKMFRDFDNPSRSIASFPFLKHFESLNIGRVYEGVHFGIPAREMQDMMIGA